MSTHDFVADTLLALPRSSWPAIAVEADVAPSTLAKIAYRHVKDPRVSNIEKLATVLHKRAIAALA
jgi:hypothetical protein